MKPRLENSQFVQSRQIFPSYTTEPRAQTAGKPAFTVVPQNTFLQCPAHKEFEITNICISDGCVEPLCPLCVKIHVELHNEKRQPAHIETIHESRKFTAEKLESTLAQLQKEQRDLGLLVSKNFQALWESQKGELDKARTKIYTIVESYFQVLEQQVLQNIEETHKLSGDESVQILNEKLNFNVAELEKLLQKVSSPDYVRSVIKVGP